MKKNKGITLIALVITIIILIILAGITINMVFGENGLILRAQEARFKTEVSGIKDLVEIKKVEIETDKQLQHPVQNLSAYLDSLGISEYIGPNKLVVDAKKKLAYNNEGEFNRQQKDWLEDIGIFPAEAGSAHLDFEIMNVNDKDVLVLFLQILGEDMANQYISDWYYETLGSPEWPGSEVSYEDFLESFDLGMPGVYSLFLNIEVARYEGWFAGSFTTGNPVIATVPELEIFFWGTEGDFNGVYLWCNPLSEGIYTFYINSLVGELERSVTINPDGTVLVDGTILLEGSLSMD